MRADPTTSRPRDENAGDGAGGGASADPRGGGGSDGGFAGAGDAALAGGSLYNAATAGAPPDAIVPSYAGPDDAADASLSAAPQRRTLVMQALVDTFAQPTARAGAVWIAVVVCLAVFAPFLASSFPIAMK